MEIEEDKNSDDSDSNPEECDEQPINFEELKKLVEENGNIEEIQREKTVIMLFGDTGAGKSTIANKILGNNFKKGKAEESNKK